MIPTYALSQPLENENTGSEGHELLELNEAKPRVPNLTFRDLGKGRSLTIFSTRNAAIERNDDREQPRKCGRNNEVQTQCEQHDDYFHE